jgi:hypothetical protein
MDAAGANEEFPQQWVRVMCDHSADAVWNARGESCGLDRLPISSVLREQLRAWQAWYDAEAPCGSSDDPPFDVQAFSRAGLKLAQEVKRELPVWTVVYFDEARLAAEFETGVRAEVQYEIA